MRACVGLGSSAWFDRRARVSKIGGANLDRSFGRPVPVLLSSLIDVPAGELAGALAADGSRCCLREWLARVPDPRSRLGRWHPLVFVLALAVCAFTAAGHDSPTAIAEWAAGCSQATLAVLGGRRDPWAGRIRPPSDAHVLAGSSAASTRRRSTRRCTATSRPCRPPAGELARGDPARARAAPRRRGRRQPGAPGLLPQAAGDGKTVRGAVRADGSQVHLLSVFDVATGTRARPAGGRRQDQRDPRAGPRHRAPGPGGHGGHPDALHTQAETARHLAEDKKRALPDDHQGQPAVPAGTPSRRRWPARTRTSRTPPGPKRAKATAAASGGPSAPPPPTASAGRTPPRSCASAATPAPPAARGRARRSPTASPACPRTWPAPATWPSTPATTGQSKTASTTSGTRPSARISSRSAPGTSRTLMPPSATWSPAHSAAPGSRTSPTPAATTAATTSAYSRSTDMHKQGGCS